MGSSQSPSRDTVPLSKIFLVNPIFFVKKIFLEILKEKLNKTFGLGKH
jgi:hypothetical protein